MKAALYLRTSTTDQHPENQRPALERYCYDRGYTVKGVYIEQESAWKAGHQKELARLLADIRGGGRNGWKVSHSRVAVKGKCQSYCLAILSVTFPVGSLGWFSFKGDPGYLCQTPKAANRRADGGRILAHGIPADAEHGGDRPLRETTLLGLMHGIPTGLLAWSRPPRYRRPG